MCQALNSAPLQMRCHLMVPIIQHTRIGSSKRNATDEPHDVVREARHDGHTVCVHLREMSRTARPETGSRWVVSRGWREGRAGSSKYFITSIYDFFFDIRYLEGCFNSQRMGSCFHINLFFKYSLSRAGPVTQNWPIHGFHLLATVTDSRSGS